MVGPARKLARDLLPLVMIVATPAAAGIVQPLHWQAAFKKVAAATQRFEVVGACRDGVPNGAYELRMADGRLRVAGAFAHGRKTGTFVFWTATGGRIAVVPYEDDLKTGTVARWYTKASGGELGRRLEAPFSENVLHGIERSWHSNGVGHSEVRYEHGTLISAKAWDRRGAPLPEAEARRMAAQDAAADERFLAELDATVRDHPPRCP
jgi:hypothetical protein